ncbi:MAG TPA: ABC transporter ATP-binding protein [Candidatus Saccharimonadales bacterium]|nr:ABC transporter ATP-binding protein [Candidatus Saccharimonadales bacterium]
MVNHKDIVVVENLHKTYGAKPAVAGISFAVRAGEVLGILGPNGAGKTTTLEMLETLRAIDGGTAMIDGLDVAREPGKVKAIIGLQTQSTAFHDRVRLTEHIELFASIFNRRVDPHALLQDVQLGDQAHKFFEQLSGGQKQRFSIAIALVNQPRVLFLDEPTTGLDPQARRNLWELIASLKKQAITVILTSHYMDEAELLCDRVAVMDDGKIIALDKPKQLIADYEKRTGKNDADLEDVFISMTGKELRD